MLATKARLRRLTKRHLQRMVKEGSKKHKEAAEKVLNNDTMKEALDVDVAALFRKKELANDKKFMGLFDGDGETPILDWLWEHREEILKFILSIIAMFAVV